MKISHINNIKSIGYTPSFNCNSKHPNNYSNKASNAASCFAIISIVFAVLAFLKSHKISAFFKNLLIKKDTNDIIKPNNDVDIKIGESITPKPADDIDIAKLAQNDEDVTVIPSKNLPEIDIKKPVNPQILLPKYQERPLLTEYINADLPAVLPTETKALTVTKGKKAQGNYGKKSSFESNNVPKTFGWHNFNFYSETSPLNTAKVDFNSIKCATFDDFKISLNAKHITNSVQPDDGTKAWITSFYMLNDHELLKDLLLTTKLPTVVKDKYSKIKNPEVLLHNENKDILKMLIKDCVENKATLDSFLQNPKMQKYYSEFLMYRNKNSMQELQTMISKHPYMANSNIELFQNCGQFYSVFTLESDKNLKNVFSFIFDRKGKVSKISKSKKESFSPDENLDVTSHYDVKANGSKVLRWSDSSYSLKNEKGLPIKYSLTNIPKKGNIMQKTTLLDDNRVMHEYLIGNKFLGVLKTNFKCDFCPTEKDKSYSLLQLMTKDSFSTYVLDGRNAPSAYVPVSSGDNLKDIFTGKIFETFPMSSKFNGMLDEAQKFPDNEGNWEYWFNYLTDFLPKISKS